MLPTYDIDFVNPTTGVKYGVDMPYENTVVTYLLDSEDNVYASTQDSEQWDWFYKQGWTKAELHQGFKEEWRSRVEETLAQLNDE